jgi:DNA-binding NtrC family response regulator
MKETTRLNRVLIVDDNVEFCANISDIMELRGYDCRSVYDGNLAVEAVREERFDLILMDIKMPGMNGVETFRKIKQIAPQARVIMITAFAVEDLIRDALREGAFAAFHKPLNFERLFDSIENLLPDGALVLVVDDNVSLCANLTDILQEKGYRIRVAHDGDAALQMSRENNFDIILLDMKLPVLNGLEAFMAIREIRPDAGVILITGHMGDMGELTRQALEQGAYICLEKPLDMECLLQTLQEIREHA